MKLKDLDKRYIDAIRGIVSVKYSAMGGIYGGCCGEVSDKAVLDYFQHIDFSEKDFFVSEKGNVVYVGRSFF